MLRTTTTFLSTSMPQQTRFSCLHMAQCYVEGEGSSPPFPYDVTCTMLAHDVNIPSYKFLANPKQIFITCRTCMHGLKRQVNKQTKWHKIPLVDPIASPSSHNE